MRKLPEVERRHVQRYPTCGPAELVGVLTETPVRVRLRDLSIAGCRVEERGRLAAGTDVKVRIKRSDTTFEALGVVIGADPVAGVGIRFKETNPANEAAIRAWIDELQPKIS